MVTVHVSIRKFSSSQTWEGSIVRESNNVTVSKIFEKAREEFASSVTPLDAQNWTAKRNVIKPVHSIDPSKVIGILKTSQAVVIVDRKLHIVTSGATDPCSPNEIIPWWVTDINFTVGDPVCITICRTDGTTESFSEPLDISIFTLKENISQIWAMNVPVNEQRLFLDGLLLEDNRPLFDYFQEATVISLQRDKEMTLEIESNTGSCLSLLLHPSTSVKELKDMIFERDGILRWQQTILLDNEVVASDDSTLESLGVQHTSKLNVLYRDVAAPVNISLLCHDGRMLSFQAPANATMNSLQFLVEEVTGDPWYEQVIMYRGSTEIENHLQAGWCLGRCGIVDEVAFSLERSTQSFGDFVVMVHSGLDKIIPIGVEPADSIGKIKRIIGRKEGIPLDQQRLFFDGKQLQDDFTISHYNIQHRSNLKLIISMRGGMYAAVSSRDGYEQLSVEVPMVRVAFDAGNAAASEIFLRCVW